MPILRRWFFTSFLLMVTGLTLGWWLQDGGTPNRSTMAREFHVGVASSLWRNHVTPIDSEEKQASGRTTGLMDQQIRELGKLAREGESDPIRKQAINTLIAHLNAENALRIRQELEHLPPHSPDYDAFHHAWGRVAGREGVIGAARFTKQASQASLAGWASVEAEGARSFFDKLQVSAHNGDGTTNFLSQEYLRPGLTKGLAEIDITLATDFIHEQFQAGLIGDKAVGELIRATTEEVVELIGQSEAATSWAVSLPVELRNEALAGLARHYAASDVEGTLEWLGGLGEEVHKGAAYYHTYHTWLQQDVNAVREHIGTLPVESYERHEAISAYVQRTIREQGAEAIPLVESIADERSRHRILSETFNSWARHDPKAASAYLAQEENAFTRDHGINGLAASIAREDPAAAIAWADEISDPHVRETALTTVALAYLETNPTAAREWLPESGLPNETMVRVLEPSLEDYHQMKFLAR